MGHISGTVTNDMYHEYTSWTCLIITQAVDPVIQLILHVQYKHDTKYLNYYKRPLYQFLQRKQRYAWDTGQGTELVLDFFHILHMYIYSEM